MKVLRADWRPDPEWPDRRRIADVEIDGEMCKLTLEDSTSYTSGSRYISLSTRAPHQGRGRLLKLEVNGVALGLEWRGGNRPWFPRRPTHAYYRREKLSPELAERLRQVPADELSVPAAPEPAAPEVNPLRAVRGPWVRRWRFWVLRIESGVPWIRKVTMKGDTEIRCRGERGPILNGPVWIGDFPITFAPHRSGNFFVARVDPVLGREIRAE